MPEREFEIYLSVLSRLLKLTPEQTAAISDELRDHLEERFEELVRSGLDRDEAIQQALDEFGDASGLAVNLTKVSQKPIRRWLIGSTVVTAVTLLVGLSAFLTSEPDVTTLPGPAAALAQDQSGTPQAIDPQTLLLDPQPDDLELAQLSNPCPIISPLDIPLQDALAQLSREHEVPIILDRLAIEEFGYNIDEPLSVPRLGFPSNESDSESDAARAQHWPHQVTLAQALDVILEELELTWIVRNGIITVTSVDAANDPSRMFSRSYNIQPLIRAGISPQTLSDVLTSNTNAMWEEIDGEGGRLINLLGNVLTIRQTFPAHREIRKLLFKLARPGTGPWIEYAEERDSLTSLLQEQLSTRGESDTPLQNWLDQLSMQFEMPIVMDRLAITELGYTVDEPVNLPSLENVPLESVLDICLDELELALILRSGVPTLTSVDIEHDSTCMTTGVYDVRRVLQVGIEAEQFVDAVQSMSGGQWEQINGTGGTLTLAENGLLVVTQTDAEHRAIQRLLTIWETSLVKNPLPDDAIGDSQLMTKFYHMPIETAESLNTVIPEMVSPEAWKSDANPEGGTIHVVALARKTLKDSSAIEKEKSETKKNDAEKESAALQERRPDFVLAQFGGGGMSGFGGRSPGNHQLMGFYSESTGVLVITQTTQVHREIDRFLASLKVSARGLYEATEMDVRGMGGGGGFF
ncbi:MAG: permease prefix domain 1-containing protein [Planctomycetota bacterium]|jgi:hypothetical protein